MTSAAEAVVARFFHLRRQLRKARPDSPDQQRLNEVVLARARREAAELAAIERAADRDEWERGQD